MKTHPLGFSLRLEFRSCVALGEPILSQFTVVSRQLNFPNFVRVAPGEPTSWQANASVPFSRGRCDPSGPAPRRHP